jgi:enamine deaminase RidA (YjgF/YER057c/UK114 family)
VSADDCSTLLRRFHGPVADEIAILSRPQVGSPDPRRQAEAAYGKLRDDLVAHGASFEDVTGETLFLRDVVGDLATVLEARERVLGASVQARAPLPSFIQQAPVDDGLCLELLTSIVVPHDRRTRSLYDLRAAASCRCDGCRRSGARLVRLGDDVSLRTTNLYGRGADAYEQTFDAFRAAEQLLEQCDMRFTDVVRTWIQLRDIDRDYDALNRARRDFFQSRGIAERPASTGVQGIPFPAMHDVSLTVQSLKSLRPRDVTGMSTPFLNEAWSYGADFSRGLKLVDGNKTMLQISGTASIDESGRTVHVGDLEAQAERMLDNIATLLARQGASFANLVSGVTYLRHAGDAALLRAVYRRRGFTGFPCALVQADLCRRELLCEAEAVAMLPPAAAGA